MTADYCLTATHDS